MASREIVAVLQLIDFIAQSADDSSLGIRWRCSLHGKRRIPRRGTYGLRLPFIQRRVAAQACTYIIPAT
jgi:hypothetical protein